MSHPRGEAYVDHWTGRHNVEVRRLARRYAEERPFANPEIEAVVDSVNREHELMGVIKTAFRTRAFNVS
jgi:hypothetical protein